MEALHCHGVKRTKVCLLHFRREDSLNYLNGRIPERWFCFKFTLFVLRKGKHSLVYLETLGQMLSKTDHTQGQIQCYNTWKLFPARTLNLLRTFLVCGSSSVSFFSTLWLKDCSSNMSLFSGSYTFHRLRLWDYQVVVIVVFHSHSSLLLYFNAAVSSMKSNIGWPCFRECLPFVG